MSDRGLDIVMGGRIVGELSEIGRRSLRLDYDPTYAADPSATPLSLGLPKEQATHSGERLHNYLWGLLPDNERVIVRWAREAGCSPSDLFALLAHVGNDVAGAAQYVAAGELAEAERPGELRPLTDAEVGTMLAAVRSDATAWHPTGSGGRWSLAGAQGKLALARTEEGWALPRGWAPTTHILKPAIDGLLDHDLNEHLCLALAQRLGIEAAKSEVVSIGGERALVIRRYDRRRGPTGPVRVHQEDVCQALGIHPTAKYENDGGPAFQLGAALLRQNAEASTADAQVEQLCLHLAFSWAVLGTDAHAKNTSFQLSGQQVRVAPLYDVASAMPYGDHPNKLRLAQKVGGEYRPTRIERRHWERVATSARLEPDALLARIETMLAALPDEAAAVRADLPRTLRPTAGKILDAIAAWSRTCRVTIRR